MSWRGVVCLAARPPDFAGAQRRAGVANQPLRSETGLIGEDREGSRSRARYAECGPAAAQHARLIGGRYA